MNICTVHRSQCMISIHLKKTPTYPKHIATDRLIKATVTLRRLTKARGAPTAAQHPRRQQTVVFTWCGTGTWILAIAASHTQVWGTRTLRAGVDHGRAHRRLSTMLSTTLQDRAFEFLDVTHLLIMVSLALCLVYVTVCLPMCVCVCVCVCVCLCVLCGTDLQ